MPRIRTESRVEKLVRIYDHIRTHGPVSAYQVGREWGSSPRHLHRWFSALRRIGVIEPCGSYPFRWRIRATYTDRRHAIERIGDRGGCAILIRGKIVAPSDQQRARARVKAMMILNPRYADGLDRYFDDEDN